MPAGRPSKIHPFIEAAKELFKELEHNIFIYTDEDLLFLVNEKLPEKDRVTTRTFERWKAAALKEKEDEDEENIPHHFSEFCRLIKKALTVEKRMLMNRMAQDDKAWTRWAWIIERKFSEWNLKKISETEIKGKGGGAVMLEIVKHSDLEDEPQD